MTSSRSLLQKRICFFTQSSTSSVSLQLCRNRPQWFLHAAFTSIQNLTMLSISVVLSEQFSSLHSSWNYVGTLSQKQHQYGIGAALKIPVRPFLHCQKQPFSLMVVLAYVRPFELNFTIFYERFKRAWHFPLLFSKQFAAVNWLVSYSYYTGLVISRRPVFN